MSGLMNMIFEVADLAVASPATVSRCGMVYMQPSLLGWRPLLTSWMATLPASMPEVHRLALLAHAILSMSIMQPFAYLASATCVHLNMAGNAKKRSFADPALAR